MKDCNRKTISLGSMLKCVNNVDEGKIYKVESFINTLYVKMDDTFLPLREFNMKEECLMDFDRIKNSITNKMHWKV